MPTPGVYTVITESVSDQPLTKLLEELLMEVVEPEPPRPLADKPPSL